MLILKTPPVEPVSLAEAKLYARISNDVEDDEVEAQITAARERVEVDSALVLMPQTWLDIRPGFPVNGIIRLDKAPFLSLTGITYWDENNEEQDLAEAVREYRQAGAIPGEIMLATSQSWPAVYDRHDAVTIEYQAGYATADNVPAAAKLAIKMLVAHWYNNRGPVTIGTITSETPKSYDNLIASFGVKNV